MTVQDKVKALVAQQLEEERKAKAINEAKGIKEYSLNPLDDMDWDDEEDL